MNKQQRAYYKAGYEAGERDALARAADTFLLFDGVPLLDADGTPLRGEQAPRYPRGNVPDWVALPEYEAALVEALRVAEQKLEAVEGQRASTIAAETDAEFAAERRREEREARGGLARLTAAPRHWFDGDVAAARKDAAVLQRQFARWRTRVNLLGEELELVRFRVDQMVAAVDNYRAAQG